MKMKTLSLCLLSMLACGSFLSSSVQATTTSLDLTVNTNVKTGTCNAQMQNAAGTAITQVVFTGPIYTDDVKNKTKSELFQIALTGCAGIPQKKILITITPASGAACDNNGTGDYFANRNSTTTGGANAVAVKVGLTHTPSTGPTVACNSNTQTEVELKPTAGRLIHFFATLVRDTGKADTDITAGTFSAPTVFNITYK